MRWIVPLVLGVLLVGCAPEGTGNAVAGSKVPWAASLDEAREQAAASNRLVMIKFYADW